ncbi:hypothetical protein [Roseomonas haemaphysalidis]|uniref:Invasion associated locus B family protein n=1 Tax=Roseomonas haemaphysalidis TaxID=2768162 RepID=A0ABS3KLZ1_9PROT|nr:hypothetical protein [Roseomonas haemaphysalidis]MBO1077598.1 hypothetical protein [Roseomonas haemaphysalidis]
MRLSTTAALLVSLTGAAAAAPAARAETFGPWLLDCATDSMTDRQSCRMTHETPVEPASAGQSAMALEVVRRGELLLPAVTARDLGLDTAGRGLLAFTGTAQIRFPPAAMLEMPCRLDGRSVVCVPRAEDAARAAAELPQAGRALVRITGLGSGGEAAPRELRLERTADALSALRARLPADGGAPAAEPGFDLRDLLGRAQRFLFPE